MRGNHWRCKALQSKGFMTADEFKEKLRHIGWSQATFAKKTGVSQNTVSRWVTGEIPQIPAWVDAYLGLAASVKDTSELIKK